MTLAPGSRLGPYEILSPLGAGGMGEVYKARDTRLERTVAVKVLPQQLSASLEVRQRFEREAKTISQLSHPHICALYDVGSYEGTEYLVMELLEGETLSDRLARGPLPLEQTLRYGVEIADALDKAHRQGIVHRDLKPGNVMLTKSGVKLLDFGLAKAMSPVAPQSSLTALPTQQGLTQEGTILGTFQYMAPEQLEGKDADARTDIFSFGAVLYEMATGKKAFAGSSQASLISSIMTSEPAAISTLQPMSPPALDRVVKTCLAKDPEERWQSAGDVGKELRWIGEGSAAGIAAPAAVSAKRRNRERLAWAMFGLAAALAVALAVAYVRRAPHPVAPLRASLVLPEKMQVIDLAISPDGRRLAFTMQKLGGLPSLWVRDLDADTARAVPGAEEGARFPFWSPDGRFIAFFGQGKLRKVASSGEAVQTICDAENGVGGTWNPEGTIVFAPTATSPLFRVPSAGGKPVPLTQLDAARHEAAHRYPSFLPDGKHFLYLATDLGTGPQTQTSIRVGSLDGRGGKALVEASSNPQFASGYLLLVRDRALLAQRFDLDRLETQGEPAVLTPRVDQTNGYLASFPFAASENALVIAPPFAPSSSLLWLDRNGNKMGSLGDPTIFGTHRLSPDASKVAAVQVNRGGTAEIWIYDVTTGVGSKFAYSPPAMYDWPAWSPDGTRLFFASNRKGPEGRPGIWVKPLDGSTEASYVLAPEDALFPEEWSRDGRTLLISKIVARGKRNFEIWSLDAADPKHQLPLETEASYQGFPRLSPDGKWMAFSSLESGKVEVYVRAFPGPGGRWKVSASGGGADAQWREDGRELYYVSLDNKMMAVPVSLEPTFHAGPPAALFTLPGAPQGSLFEAAKDGKRFLVNTTTDTAASGSPPLDLVLNWSAILQKK